MGQLGDIFGRETWKAQCWRKSGSQILDRLQLRSRHVRRFSLVNALLSRRVRYSRERCLRGRSGKELNRHLTAHVQPSHRWYCRLARAPDCGSVGTTFKAWSAWQRQSLTRNILHRRSSVSAPLYTTTTALSHLCSAHPALSRGYVPAQAPLNCTRSVLALSRGTCLCFLLLHHVSAIPTCYYHRSCLKSLEPHCRIPGRGMQHFRGS